MSQEIINYPFDSELDEDFDQPEKFAQTPGDVFENQQHSGDAGISYVNGYDLPDEDDEEEEDDLILGDEDDLDADDLAEEDIDIEVDDDIDEVSDDDLVLDADDEGDDEEDDL